VSLRDCGALAHFLDAVIVSIGCDTTVRRLQTPGFLAVCDEPRPDCHKSAPYWRHPTGSFAVTATAFDTGEPFALTHEGIMPSNGIPSRHPINPRLVRIAHAARRHGIVALTSQELIVLPDDRQLPFPIVGRRFGPSVQAIATRLGWETPAGPPVIVAIDRTGQMLVLDHAHPEPLIADDPTSVISDIARRALGLPTPHCPRRVPTLINAVWLDQMMQVTLDAALGDPPRWPQLIGTHPYRPPCHPTSTELLAHRLVRRIPTWSELRLEVIEGNCRWMPASASLAAWLDEGSLARHSFAVLPERRRLLDDLHELLRPSDYERVKTTVAALDRHQDALEP
jgi:hypothetical protein